LPAQFLSAVACSFLSGIQERSGVNADPVTRAVESLRNERFFMAAEFISNVRQSREIVAGQ
jgi:hypothetical protein